MVHIGMDVHKVHTQICVLDEEARVVCQMRVSTRRDALSKHLDEYSGSRALIEASTESEWVAKHVESLGIEVVVADPNYLAMYASRGVGKKTDKRDAQALALALKQGIYRAVVCRSAADRHKLDLLGMRDLLVRQRTAAINEVRAFCRRHGLRLPKCAAATVPKHARLLLLDSPLWDVCEPLTSFQRHLLLLGQQLGKPRESRTCIGLCRVRFCMLPLQRFQQALQKWSRAQQQRRRSPVGPATGG